MQNSRKTNKKAAKKPDYVAISEDYYYRIEHYKSGERSTIWIKLYLDLLDDVTFCLLPDYQKFHWIGLLMLAAKLNNQLPNNQKFLTQRLNATEEIDVEFFLQNGFLSPLKH